MLHRKAKVSIAYIDPDGLRRIRTVDVTVPWPPLRKDRIETHLRAIMADKLWTLKPEGVSRGFRGAATWSFWYERGKAIGPFDFSPYWDADALLPDLTNRI